MEKLRGIQKVSSELRKVFMNNKTFNMNSLKLSECTQKCHQREMKPSEYRGILFY